MKPIFEKIREAANDEKVSDKTFREIMRETFTRRQHGESLFVSFLRSYDTLKTRNMSDF